MKLVSTFATHVNLYLLRLLASSFIFSALAVTFVILFAQSFHILSLVINSSATLWVFFELMGMSIPTFLPLILPIALGVAILFVYNKLAIDSELVVMRASGLSSRRLAFPAIILASAVSITCLLLTLWLTPIANRSLVALQYKARNGPSVLLAHPGSFNDLAEGLTFFASKRIGNGGLQNILIHDVRQHEGPVTIMAESGQVTTDQGEPRLLIFNGRRQEMNTITGKLSELVFDQYVLDLDALRDAPQPRAIDPREETIFELINTPVGGEGTKTSKGRLSAEINQRFSSPLLVFTYALIGLAAILAGEFNRRGMMVRIIVAATAIILVQGGFMVLSGLIAKYAFIKFIMYIVATAPALACYLWLTSETRASFAAKKMASP